MQNHYGGNLVPLNTNTWASILQPSNLTYRNLSWRYTTNSMKNKTKQNTYTLRADTCSIIFRKLFKCSMLLGDWLNRLWPIYSMEYYAALNKEWGKISMNDVEWFLGDAVKWKRETEKDLKSYIV